MRPTSNDQQRAWAIVQGASAMMMEAIAELRENDEALARLKSGLRAIIREIESGGDFEFEDLSTLYGRSSVAYGRSHITVVKLELMLQSLQWVLDCSDARGAGSSFPRRASAI